MYNNINSSKQVFNFKEYEDLDKWFQDRWKNIKHAGDKRYELTTPDHFGDESEQWVSEDGYDIIKTAGDHFKKTIKKHPEKLIRHLNDDRYYSFYDNVAQSGFDVSVADLCKYYLLNFILGQKKNF